MGRLVGRICGYGWPRGGMYQGFGSSVELVRNGWRGAGHRPTSRRHSLSSMFCQLLSSNDSAPVLNLPLGLLEPQAFVSMEAESPSLIPPNRSPCPISPSILMVRRRLPHLRPAALLVLRLLQRVARTLNFTFSLVWSLQLDFLWSQERWLYSSKNRYLKLTKNV